MKTSVLIPVLNKWDLTSACLKSLREHTPESDGALEVMLIDNASSDATPLEAPALGQALFGADFVYRREGVNRNFAASCNLGALAAGGETLFFLNNDTLLRPGWLPPLLEALDAGASLAGPLLLYPELAGRPDRVQHLGIAFDPGLRPRHLHEGIPAAHPLAARKRTLQAITGAALLLRRDLFLAAGLFDEAFVNGLEDVEFCLRLAARGHACAVAPASSVYHLASQTPGIHARAAQNARTLLDKAGRLIFSDMQRLAAADGYALRLGPDLQTVFEPGAERLAALEERLAAGRKGAAASEECLARLPPLLEEEPYWLRGYELLAGLQEEAGQSAAAADTLFLALRLFAEPRLAARLFELCGRLRHSRAYAARAGRVLAWYRPQNFAPALREAEFRLKLYTESGLGGLAALYAAWLSRREEYEVFYRVKK